MSRIVRGTLDLYRADGTSLHISKSEVATDWSVHVFGPSFTPPLCADSFRDALRLAMRECDRLARRPEGAQAMSLDTLECPHCGDVAIEAVRRRTDDPPGGLFYDGEGERCISCGQPGTVSLDDDNDGNAIAWWNADDDQPCTRPDCEECHP